MRTTHSCIARAVIASLRPALIAGFAVGSLAGLVTAPAADADVVFRTPLLIPTATFPGPVAIGDLNNDGVPDIVAVCNTTPPTLSVIIGRGAGAFYSSRSFGLVAGGRVAIGDLNLDGRADIVIAASSLNMVAVLFGNGDGTFPAATYFPTGGGPNDVAIADLDRDGKPDLLVACVGSKGVYAMLGRGDGTFRTNTRYATPVGALALGTGDLNRDGFPDFAVVTEYGSQVLTFTNRGDGTFGAGVPYTTGDYPDAVRIGDLDGDGYGDVVACNRGYRPAGTTVSVFRNRGDGTLANGIFYDCGYFPEALSISDLDGDGRQDLAVASQTSPSLHVLLGNGDGSFGASTMYVPYVYAGAVAIGDLNQDGRPDVVVPDNQYAGQVVVLLNDSPVATLVSLAESRIEAGAVELAWWTADRGVSGATVERRADGGAWMAIGEIEPDGSGYLRFEDRDVNAGQRYGYRLTVGGTTFDEVWIDVPATALAFAGTWARRGVSHDLRVEFSLPSAAAARLELYDPTGRRVAQRQVGDLGPGAHAVDLGAGQRFSTGVYYLHLTQGASSAVSRVILLR